MQLSGSRVYAAPIDAVVALLADRAATIARYEGMGHRDVEILELDGGDDALHVKSSRVVDVDIPGFAKKVLKPTNTMVQTDDWHRNGDGTWAGSFGVEVKGAPVRIAGAMTLTPVADGTRHDVTIDLQVKVPLIGGKIADWAAKNDVQRTLDAEFDYNANRLS